MDRTIAVHGGIRFSRLLWFWLALIGAYPFVFYLFPWHPYKLFLAFWLFVTVIAVLMSEKSLSGAIVPWIVLLCAQLSAFLFLFLVHDDSEYLNLVLQSLFVLPFLYYLSSSRGSIQALAHSYVWFLIAISLFACVGFLLAFTGVWDKPVTSVGPRNLRLYFGTFTPTTIRVSSGAIIRPSGLFDEPGTLSYFIIHAVFISYLLGQSAKRRILLIALGLTTLSVAHAITGGLWLMWELRRYHRQIFRGLALSLLFIILLIGGSPDLIESMETSPLARITILRLLPDGSGRQIIRGDNRSSELNLGWQVFRTAPLFGNGITKSQTEYEHFGATFLAPFAYHGLLGGTIYFLPVVFLVYANRKNPWRRRVPIWLLMLLYSQRPYILGLFPLTSIFLVWWLIVSNHPRSSDVVPRLRETAG